MLKTAKRIGELDALRGIAALMVVLYHYTTRFEVKFGAGHGYTTAPLNFYFGFYGVQLFFIISGFVIFMTVDKVRNAKEFIKRRFIRLFPTFWFCMIITYVIVSLTGPLSLKADALSLLLNFTMIPHWLGGKAVDGAYWSLAIELVFYLTMVGLIITKLVRYIDFIGLFIMLLVLGVSIAVRFTNVFYFTSLFIAGINFYKIWSSQVRNINYINLALCLSLSFLSGDKELIILTVLFNILFVFLVFQKASFLRISPLIWLGQISYAWYLLHQNIGHTIQLYLISIGIKNYFILLLVPLLLTIGLAFLVTRYVEEPVVRLLNKKLLYK